LQWWSDLRDSLSRAFLPDRRDVTPDYWEWMQWRLTQVNVVPRDTRRYDITDGRLSAPLGIMQAPWSTWFV